MKKFIAISLVLFSLPLLSLEQEKNQNLQKKEFLKSLGLDAFKGGVALSCAAISYLIAFNFLKKADLERVQFLEEYRPVSYNDEYGIININTNNLDPIVLGLLRARREEWGVNHRIPSLKKAAIPLVLGTLLATASVYYGCKVIYKAINNLVLKNENNNKIQENTIKSLIAFTATSISICSLIKLIYQINNQVIERYPFDPEYINALRQEERTRFDYTLHAMRIVLAHDIQSDHISINYGVPILIKSITPAIVAIAGATATLCYGAKVGYHLVKKNKSEEKITH